MRQLKMNSEVNMKRCTPLMRRPEPVHTHWIMNLWKILEWCLSLAWRPRWLHETKAGRRLVLKRILRPWMLPKLKLDLQTNSRNNWQRRKRPRTRPTFWLPCKWRTYSSTDHRHLPMGNLLQISRIRTNSSTRYLRPDSTRIRPDSM